MDGRTDGRTERRTDGRTDGQTDRSRSHFRSQKCTYKFTFQIFFMHYGESVRSFIHDFACFILFPLSSLCLALCQHCHWQPQTDAACGTITPGTNFWSSKEDAEGRCYPSMLSRDFITGLPVGKSYRKGTFSVSRLLEFCLEYLGCFTGTSCAPGLVKCFIDHYTALKSNYHE